MPIVLEPTLQDAWHSSLQGVSHAGLGESALCAGGCSGVGAGEPAPSRLYGVIWGVLGTVSTAVSAFHGYRRHGSVGGALGWGLLGGLFPVLTPTIALAQGFARPKQ